MSKYMRPWLDCGGIGTFQSYPSRINKVYSILFFQVKPSGKRKVLGILDIYGFEAYDGKCGSSNGFEQFIINFCNEKLHQLFTDVMLREEQEEYRRENIEWCYVEFFNNSAICDIIETNSHGEFFPNH
jgi:Myosin heavy chain